MCVYVDLHMCTSEREREREKEREKTKKTKTNKTCKLQQLWIYRKYVEGVGSITVLLIENGLDEPCPNLWWGNLCFCSG